MKKLAAGLEGCLPIEDYVFDESKVGSSTKPVKGFYRFPPVKKVFPQLKGTEKACQNYERFRSMWCLQRRLIPMVPCPENTPLPNRRVSKVG